MPADTVPPKFIQELADWVHDLEDAIEDEEWDGVGSVVKKIQEFLATHEATGPAKVFGGQGEAAG